MLKLKAWLAGPLYRLGIIRQTTAFRWEVDLAVSGDK
jgi:hypothetical protein